jgi:uncharacterized membrane protein
MFHDAFGTYLDRVISFADRRADRIILLFITVYAIVFSAYTVLMHYAFKTYAWDLGIFTQSLWTTVNTGRPFHYTIETFVNPSQNFFGTHFSPILFLVVPVYAAFQSPLTLLAFQSLIISLAALPIYWIGRDKLHSKVWGLVFSSAFLLHPGVHSMNCFDFHVQAFIPLFFTMAFYYLDSQKWLRGIMFAVLTLATIEFAPVLVLALAVYLFLRLAFRREQLSRMVTLKRMIIPTGLAVGSVLWFLISFQVMYNINPLKSVGLPGNWDLWGRSMSEVILNVIGNPVMALGLLVNPIDKVYYVFSTMAPVFFLSFLAPFEFLLVVPWLFAALLSQYSPYYQYYYQYFGLMAGQIFIAAIYGARNLLRPPKVSLNVRVISGIEKKLMLFVVLLSIISALAISPLGLPSLTTRRIEMNSHIQMLHEILNLIPSNASVATQNDILPHLAQREEISVLGWPKQSTVDSLDADYIIVDIKSPHFLYGPSTALMSPADALVVLMANENMSRKYGMVAYEDGILLLKKDYHGEAVTKPYEESFNYENLFINPVRSYVSFDESSHSGRIIVYDINHFSGESDRIVWSGPYAYLFGGYPVEAANTGWSYSATFRMKTKTQNTTFSIDVCSLDDPNSTVSKQIKSSDFTSLNEWQDFTILFKAKGLERWEFRGWSCSNNTYVALDYVQVRQLEP